MSLINHIREALKIRHGDHVELDGVPHRVVSINKKHISAIHPDHKEIVQFRVKDFKKRFKVKT